MSSYATYAQHANTIYQNLSPQQQAALKQKAQNLKAKVTTAATNLTPTQKARLISYGKSAVGSFFGASENHRRYWKAWDSQRRGERSFA